MAGEYSSNASISGSENSTYTGAQQTPQSQFSLAISGAAEAAGEYVLAWANQVYQETSAVTDQMVNNFLQASQYGMQLAETQLDQYTNTYVPEMNQLASEAATYSSPARVQYNMGAAGANASSAAYAADQNTLQNLRSYGVDPSSGMYGDILAAQNSAAGATEAGAENQAQVNTEATGRQLLQNSVTAGEQMPGDVVNALNSAYQGISGAENSVLSNANTGSTAFGTAAPFFNAASNVKMPNTASVSKGASGSVGGGGSSPAKPAQALGNMGTPQRPAGPGLPGTATAGSPGPQTIAAGPSDAESIFGGTPGTLDSVTDGGGQYSDFGGSNPLTQIQNDPFQQQFNDYSGDQTNPFTSTIDPGANNPFGATDQSFTNGTFSTPAGPAGGFSTSASGGSGSDSDSAFDNGTSSFQNYGDIGNDSTDTTDSTWDSGTSAFDNYGNSGNYDASAGGGGGSTGGGAAAVSASGDSGDWGAGASPVTDYGGAGSNYAGGYYAQGGRVQRNFRPRMRTRGVLPVGNATTGGRVPIGASPSLGRQTDDVPARLNACEFVIPKDVAAWKGQEFFQNLISQSRKKRVTGSQAQGQPKPPLRGPPRFVSHQMGAR